MKQYKMRVNVEVEMDISVKAENELAAADNAYDKMREVIAEWQSECEYMGNAEIIDYSQAIVCEKEEKLEENCVLNECVQRGADTDWIVAWASRGPVLVQFENLDEGHCGDYDPDDPEDENLLRFTVYHNGEQVNDASYCTNIRADADREAVKKAAERILREVYDPVMAGYSVKKLCEGLSWIELEE